MYQLYRERPLLVIAIILANVILSAWCLTLDPVINFDGVTYISIAELFMRGEFSAALDHYSWPFYSLFIAGLAKLFMLSAETAALVFNTLMAISLTLAFVSVVGQLSNHNRRIILIAAVVIVLFPSISKYRSFVIRDFGYLSCYMWSLYFLFRYCATFNKNHLAAWLLFAGLSSLFRFEGLIFVLIAPYFLFLFSATKISHRRSLIVVISSILAAVCIALMYWYIQNKYMDSVEVARQAGNDINGLTDLFLMNLQQRLGDQAVSFLSVITLMLNNLGEVTGEIVRRMAVFYLAFVIYAYVKNLAMMDGLQKRIWLIYVFTNLALLIGFSLSNHFFVSRYAMATVLTLMILAPFAIDRLFNVTGKAKVGMIAAVILLLLVSLEGLDVRTDKQYIKEAGQWVADNIGDHERVYSNNKLAIYYAQRDPKDTLEQLYSQDILELFMKTNEVRTLDYVIMVGKQSNFREDVMRQTLGYHFGMPIQMNYGDDGRFAFVFQIRKPVVIDESVSGIESEAP